VVLLVSHGIFSKGTSLAGVDMIYTTNSYKQLEAKAGLKVFPVMNFLQ
jgi:ribose-phosphate pyrophosphokinase